jgi:rhamnose utilization protein RhaD (predicted bifunctional aldolase and dehydrogenase)
MSDLAQKLTKVDSTFTNNDAIQNHGSEIASLRRFSARIGRDPMLVQASNGNTSLKFNGTLWVKASGKWLAKADEQDILVPVDVSECLECLRDGRPLRRCDARRCDASSRTGYLLPSIETFMHAVLPHRFVVHVHSIDTLAWAVRADAKTQLSQRLSGLRWKWIRYVPSGLPLAREIETVCSTYPYPDVFLLGNHGLVICGESCESAEFLLGEVQRRVATKCRPFVKPESSRLETFRGFSSWRLPECEALHSLGTDRISQQIVTRGVLYPCQAMFLGRRVTLLRASDRLSDLANRIDQLDPSCPFVVVEGSGVLLNRNITAAAHAVLHGLAAVLRRIDATAPIRYLTDYEVNAIMNAYGDGYRRSAEESGPPLPGS